MPQRQPVAVSDPDNTHMFLPYISSELLLFFLQTASNQPLSVLSEKETLVSV